MLRDAYRYNPRRFMVVAETLAIYSGVYTEGEVITDFQAGSARERLVEMGLLTEVGYDLAELSSSWKLR